MPCVARARLVSRYARATASLFDRVAALTAPGAYSEAHIFDRIWCECEEARDLCTQIQQQIYAHLRDHRCALEIARLEIAKKDPVRE